eukprot:NODE_5409_length_1773_cov_23.649453.p2 GENE.NODE_5409_length_1773_cov_23.649453~~NODE_5409_length_1773_cov_23.649453.p2  ORF type:complete len:386 (+),score=130.48 NODE_5409_length_1773_cov_23.649453:69-1160(+)
MPILCIMAFFLSSVIDNLTTTIVVLKMLRNLFPQPGEDDIRHEIGCLVVIAANAGGAWSPIGDVTTTMLWIRGRISMWKTISGLFLPSLVTAILPLVAVWLMKCPCGGRKADNEDNRRYQNYEGEENEKLASIEKAPLQPEDGKDDPEITRANVAILILGMAVILLVPCLKIAVGLPPYLGMLLALGAVWLVTDVMLATCMRRKSPKQGEELSLAPSEEGVVAALRKVDLTGLLFFTGVLLCVGSLASAGVLKRYAKFIVGKTGHDPVVLAIIIGLSSAVVDNVPLVQASIDMFKEVPPDEPLWQLIAFTAGTGGSVLSIGSVAGVTFMSMEGISFMWYMRHASLWALLGFLAGVGVHRLQPW